MRVAKILAGCTYGPKTLRVIGKAFDEETVFRVAGVMEEAAQFTATPKGVAA